ncbi:MAG: Adenine deaminase [uncultured Rubrobacteraceae bacterium]|uniref:adenine deaminase n=1 Tax=uncultured Rubrobacteraceae bacterium TaxID=349277 RepID=A0A6J4PZ74_9ACTN|nr:MAG: Adenine deaminase [uncultured Rubrobacteraceae bacterium]
MLAGPEEHAKLIETARGERPAELFVRGGTIANVYSGELHRGNVAVTGGRIAYVGEGERALGPDTQVVDASGLIVSPGYIEAHFHPWVLYNPVSLVEGVLPLGTTTVLADNLFFFMQMGPEGLRAMMDDLKELPLSFLWMARLVSQAKFPGEEEMFALEKVEPLLRRDDVIGTAEVTRWPALAAGDPALISGIRAAKALGKIVDGHTGGASEARLQPVAAAGVDADHEAITRNEVLNRLRLGIWTMLRNSSLRPDLPELLRAVTEDGVSTQRLIMTTDGPAPEFIAENGLVDGMLRVAVENGVPPIQALQMVTINPATLFRIDGQVGGIGIGRQADLLLLPDLTSFRPEKVITRGRTVAENSKLTASLPHLDWGRYGSRPSFDGGLELSDPSLYPLRASTVPESEVPTIHLKSAVITERRDVRVGAESGLVTLDGQSGMLHAALVDRAGGWISRALVSGFAADLEGLASTYNTTTHLLVIGRRTEAMAQSARRVRELDGGIVVVRGGVISYELALPITGMMSDLRFSEVVLQNQRLSSAIAAEGYEHHDILYTLLFLTCDFLPALRLTPLGLLDVKTSSVLVPSERLTGPPEQ